MIRTLVSPNQDRSGYFGASVSRAGDVNDDGYDDVIVGAYNEEQGDTDIGRAYVFSGVDGSLIRTLVSPNSQGSGRFGISDPICQPRDSIEFHSVDHQNSIIDSPEQMEE